MDSCKSNVLHKSRLIHSSKTEVFIGITTFNKKLQAYISILSLHWLLYMCRLYQQGFYEDLTLFSLLLNNGKIHGYTIVTVINQVLFIRYKAKHKVFYTVLSNLFKL